jgi:hypothetical protein
MLRDIIHLLPKEETDFEPLRVPSRYEEYQMLILGKLFAFRKIAVTLGDARLLSDYLNVMQELAYLKAALQTAGPTLYTA